VFDSTASLEEGVTNRRVGLTRGAATRISQRPVSNGTNSEGIMTTRKPKPTYPPLIEFPSEQLELVPVTVEHKAPPRAGQTWLAETDLPSVRQRGKMSFH
jgi:hypothetical protein